MPEDFGSDSQTSFLVGLCARFLLHRLLVLGGFLYNESVSLPLALRKHPGPGATGGECGEAERRLYGVLHGGSVHQEAGGREGGEGLWPGHKGAPPQTGEGFTGWGLGYSIPVRPVVVHCVHPVKLNHQHRGTEMLPLIPPPPRIPNSCRSKLSGPDPFGQ